MTTLHPTLLRAWMILAAASATTFLGMSVAVADDPRPIWSTDYAATMSEAERGASLMLVYFVDEADPACAKFEEALARSQQTTRRLSACPCVRLPLDAEITVHGEAIRLLEHPAFSELHGRPGLAVLDFQIEDLARKGRVLRTLPLLADADGFAEQLSFLPIPPASASSPKGAPAEVSPHWMNDYSKARRKAEQEGRMLLIYFRRPNGEGGCESFEAETLANAGIRAGLSDYVCLKVTCDTTVNINGRETVLLEQDAFAEMTGLPGIAIVDFQNPAAEQYGQVVSTFPFLKGKAYSIREMDVILRLPPGPLTQRTLIYAVRTHPDNPRGASGEQDSYLASEAEKHSQYQAQLRLQGHHTWETRFHRINRRLPGGLLATEVCAESWPGESLLEAAIECVRCWRLSAGHWRSVHAAHPVFGFDMRRGSNGIWYATGIFGKRAR